MKPIFTAVLTLLSLLLPVRADEAPEHPVKPLLWKIEGGGLEKPSYLFGTIHLGGGPLDKLHPAAEKAFTEAEIVYTEIPLDTKTQLASVAKIMRDDGKTLSQSIGPNLTKQLDAELRAINPALNSLPFQPMRTWAIAISLPMLEAQFAGKVAIDQMVWNRATREGKKTAALETAEFQFGLLDAFTEEEQVKLLSETLRLMRDDRAKGTDSIKELTDAYIQGDADLIKRLVDKGVAEMRGGPEKELGEKLFDKLLIKRDASMATTIAGKLKDSPATVHFFAAGAAHFTGEPSIRSNLEKAGYRITRVEQ